MFLASPEVTMDQQWRATADGAVQVKIDCTVHSNPPSQVISSLWWYINQWINHQSSIITHQQINKWINTQINQSSKQVERNMFDILRQSQYCHNTGKGHFKALPICKSLKLIPQKLKTKELAVLQGRREVNYAKRVSKCAAATFHGNAALQAWHCLHLSFSFDEISDLG